MMNSIIFFILFILWVVLVFKVLDKTKYGVLWYPATFAVVFILGSVFGIAQRGKPLKQFLNLLLTVK